MKNKNGLTLDTRLEFVAHINDEHGEPIEVATEATPFLATYPFLSKSNAVDYLRALGLRELTQAEAFVLTDQLVREMTQNNPKRTLARQWREVKRKSYENLQRLLDGGTLSYFDVMGIAAYDFLANALGKEINTYNGHSLAPPAFVVVFTLWLGEGRKESVDVVGVHPWGANYTTPPAWFLFRGGTSHTLSVFHPCIRFALTFRNGEGKEVAFISGETNAAGTTHRDEMDIAIFDGGEHVLQVVEEVFEFLLPWFYIMDFIEEVQERLISEPNKD